MRACFCPVRHVIMSADYGVFGAKVLGPLWLLQQGGEYLPAVLGLWGAAGIFASAGLLAKRGSD